MSPIVPQSTDHQVRLLLPFFMDRNALGETKEALCSWFHINHKSRVCWQEPDVIPTLYQDETLPSVRNFLFGKDSGCCAYFRVPDETRNFWFKRKGAFSKSSEPSKVATEFCNR